MGGLLAFLPNYSLQNHPWPCITWNLTFFMLLDSLGWIFCTCLIQNKQEKLVVMMANWDLCHGLNEDKHFWIT